MFTYHPVDITSLLIVSISVFRQQQYCASRDDVFYMFCLIAHSAFTISWMLHDVPRMLHVLSVSSGAAIIIKLYVYPLRPELRNHTRDSSLSPDGLSKMSVELSMHRFPLMFFCLLVFNAGLKCCS